ncbi:MAG: hypothetical protein M3X11_04645 [Acidobacteriota bacterium]|nr:hypothetical protein [Acidobacteriota bacterium]
MNILFDHNTPRPLRKYLPDHRVALTKEMNWQGLANGKLLAEAEQLFEVIITTDTNIEHQNQVADFNLAMIVLRGYSNGSRELAALMPHVNEALKEIQPGQVLHFYVDERLRQIDQRKGKIE